MDIRKSIIFVAGLTLVVTLFGGYYHFFEARSKAMVDEHQRASGLLASSMVHLGKYLDDFKKDTRLIAGLPTIRDAFLLKTPQVISQASLTLDYFNEMLEMDVCYLMDEKGTVIASSNRNSPQSFVGKTYGFRPYFQQAIKGKPYLYPAIGVTSGKRGVYSSHPVYGPDQKKPLGVIVVKVPVDFLNKGISAIRDGFITVNSSNGIVFLTSHKEFENKLLWKITEKEIGHIKKSRQFGAGPWPWVGLVRKGDDLAVDRHGKEFKIHQSDLAGVFGWKILYFHDKQTLSEKVYGPLLKNTGFEIAIFTLVIFGLLIYLYVSAEKDLRHRKNAEEQREKVISKLQKAFDEIKSLRGILPLCSYCKKVRDDEGYWQQVDVYIQHYSEADVSHSICPGCLKEHYPDVYEEVICDEKSELDLS